MGHDIPAGSRNVGVAGHTGYRTGLRGGAYLNGTRFQVRPSVRRMRSASPVGNPDESCLQRVIWAPSREIAEKQTSSEYW